MDSMKLILLTQLLSLVMSARLHGMQEENQEASAAHWGEEVVVVSAPPERQVEGIEVLTKSKNRAADEIVILISRFKNRALR